MTSFAPPVIDTLKLYFGIILAFVGFTLLGWIMVHWFSRPKPEKGGESLPVPRAPEEKVTCSKNKHLYKS